MRGAAAGANVWKTVRDYACNTGRVSFSLISDSNGLHTDFGWTQGLMRAIRSSGVPLFGTGLIGARHSRLKYTQGGGQQWAWQRYGSSAAISGTATTKTKINFELTNFNTVASTVTVISGTDFTNYTFNAGDRLTVVNSSGTLVGEFTVAGRTSSTVITTTSAIGTLTGASGFLTGAAGTSSNSTVPSAFARRNNIPQNWLPLGNSSIYHTGGTCFSTTAIATQIFGPLPANGRMTMSCIMAKAAAGKTGTVQIDAIDTSFGSFSNLSSTAYNVSGGADGDLVVARSTTTASSTRVTSVGTREYIQGAQGEGTGDNGAGLNLFGHLCNPDLPRGFSLNAFLCRGGMSAYDVAEICRFIDTQTWEAYFYGVADQHASAVGGNDAVRHVVIINLGFNDAGESVLSYDSTNLSSTKSGHKANVQDIMATIRTQWNAARGANADRTELFFMLLPSHCISDAPTTPGTSNRHAQEASVRLYRTAQREIVGSTYNTFFVDIQALWGTEAFAILNNAQLTYVKDTDVLHMLPGGYECLAAGAIQALNVAAGGRGFLSIGGSL